MPFTAAPHGGVLQCAASYRYTAGTGLPEPMLAHTESIEWQVQQEPSMEVATFHWYYPWSGTARGPLLPELACRLELGQAHS